MSALHSGPLLAERDGLRVIDCHACGWAHLDPLPVLDDAYYREHFWSTKGAGWLARYEAERDWLDMRHGDWLSVIDEHIAPPGRLLDVGSGYGFFLHQARLRGWGGIGIEPSLDAVAYSRGITSAPISNTVWENYTGGYCECISAFWLLEHLRDPRAFLAWARAHLAPGGVLAVCVPQEFTCIQSHANALAIVPNYYVHPTHLNYWTGAMLGNLLGRSRFRVVDAIASFPMEEFILKGNDYTDNESAGDRCHAQVRQMELKETRDARLRTMREGARNALGRDLLVIAKVDA